MKVRPKSLSSAVVAAIVIGAMSGLASCGSDDPTGPSGGDGLTVELRNYSSTSYQMGVQGGTLVTVAGNPTTGNPTTTRVTDPGLGGSLNFVATAGTTTLNATCTVTTATGVSELPMVVLQGAFNVLECVSW